MQGVAVAPLPASLPLSFSSRLVFQFFFYLYFSLVASQHNSPYLIVLVKLIACPPDVSAAFLWNNSSQGLTIWGTVSHSEDAGGGAPAVSHLWRDRPSEVTHSCSACADKEGGGVLGPERCLLN